MNPSHDADPNPTHARSAKRRKRFGRRFLLWTGLPLLALGGAFVGRAWAHGRGFGCRHGGQGGAHEGGDHSAEHMVEHMQRGVDRVLSHLDATDAQRDQARAIVAQRAPELHAVHVEGRALKRQALVALRQADSAELEALRKRGLAVMDRGSTIFLASLQSLSDVLDPEQRAALFEHFERGPWGW